MRTVLAYKLKIRIGEKKMKKLNNKGFSLVELIVVIAIMAILAVTLAPRLVQYVDRARTASDQEAANTVFTAVKLANLEAPLADGDSFNLEDTLYAVTNKKWAVSAYTVADPLTEPPQEFFNIMLEILADFDLKSSEADADTSIIVAKSAEGKLSVTLDYDGTGYLEADGDYKVSE